MKNSYVMFLDFDGPLFSSRALMLPENNEYAKYTLNELKMHPVVSYWYADPVAIAMLIELYRFRPFQLVISSAWSDKDLHNKEQIENLLKKNGLGIPFHINWSTPKEKTNVRIEQIKEWLDNHSCNDYLILDDYDSGDMFSDEKVLKDLNLDKEKIVLVSFDDGILTRDFYKMKAILANWD